MGAGRVTGPRPGKGKKPTTIEGEREKKPPSRPAKETLSGLTTETQAIEYREGSEPISPRKLPGLKKHNPITLKRGRSEEELASKRAEQYLVGQVQKDRLTRGKKTYNRQGQVEVEKKTDSRSEGGVDELRTTNRTYNRRGQVVHQVEKKTDSPGKAKKPTPKRRGRKKETFTFLDLLKWLKKYSLDALFPDYFDSRYGEADLYEMDRQEMELEKKAVAEEEKKQKKLKMELEKGNKRLRDRLARPD